MTKAIHARDSVGPRDERAAIGTLKRIGRAILHALRASARRRVQRHTLHDLDDHLLADIGITRAQAQKEAAKPFWVQ